METPITAETPQSFEALLEQAEALMMKLPPKLRGNFPVDRLRSCDTEGTEQMRQALLTLVQTLEQEIPLAATLHAAVETFREARQHVDRVRRNIENAFIRQRKRVERRPKSPTPKEQATIEQENLAMVAQVEGWQSDVVKAEDLVRQNEEQEGPLAECMERMEATLQQWNETMQQILLRSPRATSRENGHMRAPIEDGGFDPADIAYRDHVQHVLSSFVVHRFDEKAYPRVLKRFLLISLNNKPGTLKKNLTPEVAHILVTLQQVQQLAATRVAAFKKGIEDLRSILRNGCSKSGKRIDPNFLIDLPDLMLKSQGAQRSAREWVESIQKDSSSALEEICALADLIRHYQRWLQQPINSELSIGAYAYCILHFSERIADLMKQHPELTDTIYAAFPITALPELRDQTTYEETQASNSEFCTIENVTEPAASVLATPETICVDPSFAPALKNPVPADCRQVEEWNKKYREPYLQEKGPGGRLILYLTQQGVVEAIQNRIRDRSPADAIRMIERNLLELNVLGPDIDLKINALNTVITDISLHCRDAIRSGQYSLLHLLIPKGLPVQHQSEWIRMQDQMQWRGALKEELCVDNKQPASECMEKYEAAAVEAGRQWEQFQARVVTLSMMLERDTGGNKEARGEEMMDAVSEALGTFMIKSADDFLQNMCREVDKYNDPLLVMNVLRTGVRVELERMRNGNDSERMRAKAAIMILRMRAKMEEAYAACQ